MTRDRRFVATHRGGPLDQESHRLLAVWAADCAEHVLPLFEARRPQDDRPRRAVQLARSWARGEVRTGECMRASVAAHAAARESADDSSTAAARACGHAAATAHMADHSLGAAHYAVKAARFSADTAGGGEAAAGRERACQLDRLPVQVRELVTSAFAQRPGL